MNILRINFTPKLQDRTLVPVCMYCGAWRSTQADDQWRPQPVPSSDGIALSHGCCEPCADLHLRTTETLMAKLA